MRPIIPSALIALGVTLAGCGPVNRSLNSVNQPIVSQTSYVFDARADGGSLSDGEAARLAGWFDSLKLGYGDKVSLDDPSGSGAARDTVARIAAHYGLLLSPTAPVTAGTPTPGAVRIVVSRSAADVPHCPNWDRASQPEFAASTMSNYGCANNANLAAMVADPQDLIRGRQGDGSDPRVATRAVRVFRDGDITGKPGQVLGATATSTKGGQ